MLAGPDLSRAPLKPAASGMFPRASPATCPTSSGQDWRGDVIGTHLHRPSRDPLAARTTGFADRAGRAAHRWCRDSRWRSELVALVERLSQTARRDRVGAREHTDADVACVAAGAAAGGAGPYSCVARACRRRQRNGTGRGVRSSAGVGTDRRTHGARRAAQIVDAQVLLTPCSGAPASRRRAPWRPRRRTCWCGRPAPVTCSCPRDL